LEIQPIPTSKSLTGERVRSVVLSLQSESIKKVLILGALFGLITYATYDLTNLATVKDWPLIVTVVDLVWGGVLATSVSYLGFLAGKWLQ